MPHISDVAKRPGSRWRAALDIITSFVLIGAAVAVVVITLSGRRPLARTELKLPSEPISVHGAAIKGAMTAPMAMIIFSDFQCPFCARFAREVLPRLENEYINSGRLLFAYRHLPLPNHQHATRAAQLAHCAGSQGLFWAVHDRIFAGDVALDATLNGVVDVEGLDHQTLAACIEDPLTEDAVLRDAEEAKRLGLTSTPSFLLGSRQPDGQVRVSRLFAGVRPIEHFRRELELAAGSTTLFQSAWRTFSSLTQ